MYKRSDFFPFYQPLPIQILLKLTIEDILYRHSISLQFVCPQITIIQCVPSFPGTVKQRNTKTHH